jgi:hypothetical protein
MARKTASDLVDELACLGEEIQKRTAAETRKDAASSIEDQFLGTRSRALYCGSSADDCVVQALTEFPSLTDRRLQGLAERFDAEGVSDDFRAGILFAARLIADKDFEF